MFWLHGNAVSASELNLQQGLTMKPPLLAGGCGFEPADDNCSNSVLPILLCAVSAGLRAPAILVVKFFPLHSETSGSLLERSD